jgi:aldose 1-epimerase
VTQSDHQENPGLWSALQTCHCDVRKFGDIQCVDLSNPGGVSARILNIGASLQSFITPDRYGNFSDILLGYDNYSYYKGCTKYFGATIGRFANRIARARFQLDEIEYALSKNEGLHSLHGGKCGFDQALWNIVATSSGDVASVTLRHISADGDQGYPGTVVADVTYTLDRDCDLQISFYAVTTAPTIINLTNHALFNLSGADSNTSAMRHNLVIPANHFTPIGASRVPTGELRRVDQSVFDFRAGQTLEGGLRRGDEQQIRYGRGYDHNFVLEKGQTANPQLSARLEDEISGRILEVLSTEPGIQVYSGNFLHGTTLGKMGNLYRMGDGIALEPQKFPDTPNQPSFGCARIDPDTPYQHTMIYRGLLSK